MKFKATIFDLDGTVVADEDEYGEAFNRVLRRFGIDTGLAYPHVAGIGVEENWEKFKRKYKNKINESTDLLSLGTQKEYLKLLKNVKPKNGFVKFVETIRKEGVKTALATSNSWSMTDRIMQTLGLESYFDCITTAEEVNYKKPDPQIFEITIKKLCLVPEDCVVFEDSRAGLVAAKTLGMKVVAFYRSEKHKKALKKADVIVRDFTELDIEELYR
jgi:HAD superfamily hydrolase (TIGR01509 family)